MIQLIADGFTDNYPIVQEYINRLQKPSRILVPDGVCFFSDTIRMMNKSVRFIGNDYSELMFKPGVSAFHITRDRSTPPCYFEHLTIRGGGNRYKADRKTSAFPGVHAMVMHSRCDFNTVNITNFGGDGLLFHGSMESYKTNVSHSHIFNVEISKCENAIFVDGPDANVLHFDHIDLRDNAGYGIFDSSYLGIRVEVLLAQNNRRGHVCMDLNERGSRSMYIGCYQEQGVPPSEICGHAIVDGGNKGEGWLTYHNSTFRSSVKEMQANDVVNDKYLAYKKKRLEQFK